MDGEVLEIIQKKEREKRVEGMREGWVGGGRDWRKEEGGRKGYLERRKCKFT